MLTGYKVILSKAERIFNAQFLPKTKEELKDI